MSYPNPLDSTSLSKYQGDHGSAVTCFPTEYRWQPDGEVSDFAVEVEYFRPLEFPEHLEELFWSFRQPYAPNLKEDLGGDELRELERASKAAGDALKAAFGHHPGFNVDSLKDFSDGSYDAILSTLCAWAEKIKLPSGAVDGVWKASANTEDECRELARSFMVDNLWPFTKIMRSDISVCFSTPTVN